MSGPSKQKRDYTVLWWIGWITLTLVSFFVCSWFWTPLIAKHVGTMDHPSAPVIWVIAVFGSWMVLLVPLIIVMYNKVDRAYEDTRNRKEQETWRKKASLTPLKSVAIPEEDRLLSKALVQKLRKIPQTIKRGHLVTAVLKNGGKVDHVFIVDREQVVGIYGIDAPSFAVSDIVDIIPADLDRLPRFEAEGWLRLDGADRL